MGWRCVDRIRACPGDTYTYVIILTAKDSSEDILETFAAGADDYVAKPYDIRELQARLNTGKRVLKLEDTHKGSSGDPDQQPQQDPDSIRCPSGRDPYHRPRT